MELTFKDLTRLSLFWSGCGTYLFPSLIWPFWLGYKSIKMEPIKFDRIWLIVDPGLFEVQVWICFKLSVDGSYLGWAWILCRMEEKDSYGWLQLVGLKLSWIQFILQDGDFLVRFNYVKTLVKYTLDIGQVWVESTSHWMPNLWTKYNGQIL